MIPIAFPDLSHMLKRNNMLLKQEICFLSEEEFEYFKSKCDTVKEFTEIVGSSLLPSTTDEFTYGDIFCESVLGAKIVDTDIKFASHVSDSRVQILRDILIDIASLEKSKTNLNL